MRSDVRAAVSRAPSAGAGGGSARVHASAPAGGAAERAPLSSENPLCPFTGKTGWESKSGAQQALKAQRQQGLEVWRVYMCQCGLWHVTSKRGAKRR